MYIGIPACPSSYLLLLETSFFLILSQILLITPDHYADITVERAVSKLCGYPLCPNTLDKVSIANRGIGAKLL